MRLQPTWSHMMLAHLNRLSQAQVRASSNDTVIRVGNPIDSLIQCMGCSAPCVATALFDICAGIALSDVRPSGLPVWFLDART